jgi:hypothetical protein
VFRGWTGERASYASFTYGDLSWQCDPTHPVGINPVGCARLGISLDGALPEEMRRGGSLQWPPAATDYAWEGMQGAVLQAELLRIQGYDAWSWGSKALLRAARFLYERARWPATGDDQWQPWLIDKRYGTSYHTAAPARGGKNFGFTDWLYGPAGSGTSAPAAAATPTPRPTAAPTPRATAAPTPTPTAAPTATPTDAAGQPTADPTPVADPTPTPDATAAPTAEPTPAPTARPKPPTDTQSVHPPKVTRPTIKLSSAALVPTAGVPVVVDWGLASTDNGLSSYQLQRRIDDGAWTPLGLASATTSASTRNVPSGASVRFRVRAIDRAGTVGSWVSSGTFRVTAVADSSSAIKWSGSWSLASHTAYLGKRVHSTAARGATATLAFSGSGIAWAGPVGPTRGKARVFIDGRQVATVDLYRSKFAARDLVLARNLGDGSHTLRIETLATSGRPTIAIDELYVIDPR